MIAFCLYCLQMSSYVYQTLQKRVLYTSADVNFYVKSTTTRLFIYKKKHTFFLRAHFYVSILND